MAMLVQEVKKINLHELEREMGQDLQDFIEENNIGDCDVLVPIVLYDGLYDADDMSATAQMVRFINKKLGIKNTTAYIEVSY